MRGAAFILIFLFLVIPVSAETGDFSTDGALSYEFTATYQSDATGAITHILIQDAAVGNIHQVTTIIPAAYWAGNTAVTSQWDTSVNFHVDGNPIGSGVLGWNKGGDGDYHVIAFLSDCDFSGLTGKKYITWTDYKYPTTDMQGATYQYYVNLPDNRAAAFVYWDGGFSRWVVIAYSSNNVQRDYSFLNEYEYTFIGGYFFEMNRSSTHTSKIKIVDSGGNELVNETAFQTIPYEYWSDDLDNSTWTITNENYYGNIEIDVISFVAIVTSEGTIELNQSSYAEPELIQIDAKLTAYDFDNHIYRILMEYSTDDGANWERLSVAFNSTSMMSSTTECRTATIDSSYYTLPIKIRAVIDDYDKATSSSSTIATSSEVYYNPPSAYDYIVSGTVFDADNGAVIEGAVVSASGVTTTSSTSTVTGKFQLYLSEGYYTITTSKSGYQDNVQTDLLIDHDVTWAQIHLTPIGYGNNTLYGYVNDVDTGYAIQDVHVIITNDTNQIDAYTSSGGYYEATGLAQSSTYAIRAVKSGYYTYNGSVTTAASGATYKAFDMVPETATPTPTPTVGPTATYPGGEGHEWSNDEIVTMLRVLVPGIFLMMLIFLLLAVMMGFMPNNGGNQGNSGLGELWRRY